MAKETMRAFSFEGKRRGISLDSATWAGIDWLAAKRGVKWATLAQEWATVGTHGPQSDSNLTRIIRQSAMAEVLSATIFAERADQYASAGPIQLSLGECSDDSFEYALSQANAVRFQDEYGGFDVSIADNEFGRATIYIRNGVRGFPHLTISLPISCDEWATRAAE